MSDVSPSHLDPLLADAPARVVFEWLAPELEAARCNLAAFLIHQDRFADVLRYHYAFSLGLALAGPGTGYVHYFSAPNDGADGRDTDGDGADGARPLVPVTTVHTPGVDDLGGLIRLVP